MQSNSDMDNEGGSDSVSVSVSSSEQCFLRAQLFYQVVQPWHIADAGLEFDLNISTGVNKARFPNTLDLDKAGNEERLRAAVQAGTTVVPADSSRGDGAALQKKLESAATWGREEELGYLLRSCYVTEADALPALAEASMRGGGPCVALLLRAGVSGCAPIPNSSANKNALHVACENGQEECAKMIISSLKCREDVYTLCTCGAEQLTCFDLLRRSDLGGMARRLEAHVDHVFGKSSEET